MGQEIKTTSYTLEDERHFAHQLREETKILKRWFDRDYFDKTNAKCGLELEAWLVTDDFVPAPMSDQFLKRVNHPLIVPEISKFNFEFNSEPYQKRDKVFSQLEHETLVLWNKCEQEASAMKLKPLMIGTLPTLRDHMLTMDNLSPQNRYFMLNERIMRQRQGKPIVLEFEGKDSLFLKHNDIMTECAATSLQIHFGVSPHQAARYYNASCAASAFIAAAAANAPFFYGKELWDESRIPIFEQSVNLNCFRKKSGQYATRVSLGTDYVRHSVMELFLENLDGHPILLPEQFSSAPEKLSHLRFHNGTIWRWNRPLIGFDPDGTPSLRLEFRIPSAGPSMRDSLANMMLQIALVEYFFRLDDLEQKLPFKDAEANFYQACRHGFNGTVKWIDQKNYNLQELLLNIIFPQAVQTVEAHCSFHPSEIQKYLLETIKPRLQSGQNGASWQKAFVHTHGCRFQEMLELYEQYQKQNLPVHLWKV